MNNKSIILFLVAIILLIAIYNIPAYNNWMHNKIWTVCNFGEQAAHMSLEERRESRYGYSYYVFKDISAKLGKFDNVTLLLPPDNYLQAMKVTDVKMVEPAVFYYFTGISAVTVKSPKVWSANWALVSKNTGAISLIRLWNRRQADSQIAVFRQYQQ